jgi:hypothetical protein
MKIIRHTTALIFCLIAHSSSAQADEACARETNPQKKAACIKIDHGKRSANKDNVKFTHQLLTKGDALFKKRKYYQASRAYDLANTYIPSPYAYLRESESLFLAYVTASGFEDGNGKSTGQCLRPERFIDMADDTFAKIHQAGPVISPAYLADAEKRINCLEGLATQYRAVKTGCVDITRLQACMGVKK